MYYILALLGLAIRLNHQNKGFQLAGAVGQYLSSLIIKLFSSSLGIYISDFMKIIGMIFMC